MALLSPEVRQKILLENIPLGRILLEHNVLTKVQLQALWRVLPGPALRKLFTIPAGQITYGRTATIHCNGGPAIELLEIVSPVEPT